MVKRLITIILLLTFSTLPVAAQMFQVVDLLREAISQAEGEEMMECCAVAGQCKMAMPEETNCTEAPDMPMECMCDATDPDLPLGLLTTTPQLPSVDETLVVQLPLTKWTELLPTNSRLQFKSLPRTNQITLRHACLRI